MDTIELKREQVMNLQPRDPDQFEAAREAVGFAQSRFVYRDLVEKRMLALRWMKQNRIPHITERG